MPRVVPSDVVSAAERLFPEMARDPNKFPELDSSQVPSILALATLVRAVPDHLIVLDPQHYAALVASTAALEAMPAAFQGHRGLGTLQLRLRGWDENPVWIIRLAMVACPEEAPAAATNALAFIDDADLRESIRLDMSAADTNLANGEWKGATVLAASAVEALLLWALQEHQKAKPADVAAAVPAALKRDLGTDLEGRDWHLHEYLEVAAHLKLVTGDTAQLVRLAKDARNLVHPGRAARLGQKCDRSTALRALAAAEAVARDLAI